MNWDFQSPLDVALQAVRNTFATGMPVLRTESTLFFSADFPSMDSFTIEFSIDLCLKREELVISAAMASILITPWSHMDAFFDELDFNLDAFFEGYYKRKGILELYPDEEKVVPGHEEEIGYAALDDQELLDEVSTALGSAVRALALIAPIIKYLEIAGVEPNAYERMRLLGYSHGSMEVLPISSDVPDRAVRLPTRLFGGVGILAAQ